MDKNRRKTPLYIQDDPSQSISRPINRSLYFCDKENEARLALLDLGNYDDTMLHIDVVLADQHPNRNSLIEQMKAHQTHILGRQIQKNVFSEHEIHALLPIDNNCNFQLDNFVEDKRIQTSNKKQRFSLRNTLYFKSKENLVPLKKDPDYKRQQKTIHKLKKILKKLQSPQKGKHNHQDHCEESDEKMKKKKSVNKIAQFCTQFLYKNMPTFKQVPVNEFSSHQKPVQTYNQQSQQQTVKFYQFRTGSKTSHQKHRSSLTRILGASTPTAIPFFHKPTKLTNKKMLLKRNSVTTGELFTQKNQNKSVKKTSARMAHQISRSNLDQMYVDEMFIQNEKRREDKRRSRNLRNILFE